MGSSYSYKYFFCYRLLYGLSSFQIVGKEFFPLDFFCCHIVVTQDGDEVALCFLDPIPRTRVTPYFLISKCEPHLHLRMHLYKY
jgi:hypothetical protein